MLNLKSVDDTEEIKDHRFQQLIAELSFTIVEGTKSVHAHYGESYEKISKLKKKIFYKCWECEGTELLIRVLRRAAGSDEETIVSETSTGTKHERKHYISDFTNPNEQTYGTGIITSAPEGVESINKQVLENTFNGLRGKLRL
jgi:hypothetical protein